MSGIWIKTKAAICRVVLWMDKRVPRGARSILGVLLIAGGCFGFLPVLGFWMIPAGLAAIALDIPPWRRWVLKRVSAEQSGSPEA
jgi:hypothetical protein